MNQLKIYWMTLIITFGLIASVSSEDGTFLNCAEQFKYNNHCPEELCKMGCLSDINYEDCEISCLPKSCLDMSAELCPLNRCQVLLGCDGKDVCYFTMSAEEPQCGELGYVGGADCCDGYQKRCGVEFFDKSCDMAAKYSIYGVPICLPCGNDICNQFENECNCPEDCKQGY